MGSPETVSAEFLEKVQRSCCPHLREAPLNGDDFLSRAKRALLKALERLDALSRVDPF